MTANDAAIVASICALLLALVNVVGQVLLARQAASNRKESHGEHLVAMNGSASQDPVD
jgi:hypothetical protein